MSRTIDEGKPGAPETATEEIDRKEEGLPNGGVSPEYDDRGEDLDRAEEDEDGGGVPPIDAIVSPS